MTDWAKNQAGAALKIASPRFPREPLSRAGLSLDTPILHGVPAIWVVAPGGYGKTSILSQWRRECLSEGRVVAWFSAAVSDTPLLLLHGLALSYREAAMRPTFGHTLIESVGTAELEAVALLLSEIAASAIESVVIVDDAERLPAASRELLSYILHNLPPNLRVFIGTRSLDGFRIADLRSYGQCEVIEASQLAFELTETYELFRQRLGDRFDADSVAQLHQMACGWPLGIQLALSAQMRSRTPLPMAQLLSDTRGELQDNFVSLLFAQLGADDLHLLVRMSVLEGFTSDLCAAVSDQPGAETRLDHIVRSTPVVQLSEKSDWMRLHPLARSDLQRRFATLPQAEQTAVHEKAARWLDVHALPYEAMRHAFAAGDTNRALDLAERGLYRAMMTTGGVGPVQAWAGVLPDSALDTRPSLLLSEAWSLALSERHVEAGRLIDRIMARAEVDDALRCETDLILGAAAAFADDPDRFSRLHETWAADPPLENPLLLRVHANRMAYLALLGGEPALARTRQQRAPLAADSQHSRYLSRWYDFIIGLSYYWEGQVRLAERILAPAMLQSEADLGRRDFATSMLAAVLAAAAWEGGRAEEATLLLADRMDVLERKGLPEALMLGYRTLARIANARNDEPRALEILGALDAVGTVRGLVRMTVISLCEQIRIHAQGYRAQSCEDLLARLEQVLANPGTPTGKLWRRSVTVHVDLARGLTAIAARDWASALPHLDRANLVARSIKQERVVIETTGLLAFVQHQTGEDAQSKAREAVELAHLFGLRRVFADAHPDAARWLLTFAQNATDAAGRTGAAQTEAGEAPTPPTPARSSVLTPREWDVLDHLARNLSNKEIARALDVHDETVKWHVKNLFVKLDAGSRRQVVSRARLMGLLG
jgi:LuxR family maltose regulon positive regulatory protein